MNRGCGSLTIVVLLVSALRGGPAEARGPSTPEERARVIALARSLERDPLDEGAPAARRWLQEWIVEVPDMSFRQCADLFGHGLDERHPYARELKQQVTFSGAAFTIERQDKARDDEAVYTAGVEGSLRAYEALVRSAADARSAFLDDLIARRDRGGLAAHVAALARQRCRRSNLMWIAAPAGAAVGLVLALLVGRWLPGRAGRSPARPSIARAIVFAAGAYYVIVVGALHVLEPDYDPRYRFVSDYAWAGYGWLMTTTFFVLGAAAVTVAVALKDVHRHSWGARTGVGLLIVAGLSVCLAGVFRGFPLHDAASAVAFPSMTLAALLLAWSFRRASGWRVIHPVAFAIALGMLAAFLSMLASVGMPGLQQRAFLVLFLLWLSTVVQRLARMTVPA